MPKKRKGFKSDFAKIDAHVTQPEEYEDLPEWTDEMFDAADLYIGGKLTRRGRPPKADPKKAIKLRLDSDIIERFRATGKGWHTRINNALREWMDENLT